MARHPHHHQPPDDPFRLQSRDTQHDDRPHRSGWLRLSFGSEGVEDLTQFDAATMIKNVKIVFTPSKALMAEIRKDLVFENAGVVEEGFTFPTTKAYLDYKQTGQLPTPGGSGTGGSDDDDSGQGTFG